MATVLITGANRGIGLEFTTQYLQRGDKVIATCRDIENADALNALGTKTPALEILPLDVSDHDSIAKFPSQLKNAAIDIFINNAGIYGPRDSRFGNVNAYEWMEVLQVNSIAPLLLTQELIGHLRAGKDKKLIYLTSKMGSIADNNGGGHYLYRSSKTALNMVVKSLAVDLGSEGFVSAVLHPGWVRTDMGGPNGMIDTNTSVTGMVKVIDGLSSKDNGGFFNYDGAVIPW